MRRVVKTFLIIAGYFALAILVGRGAYWGHGWPLWACVLMAAPILVIGICVGYALYGSETE